MSLVNELIDNDDNSSINSSSISNTNQSLKEKYERLVSEYTKQKTKLNVIKKAYLELNEVSKEKEQIIRKNEQEIESLNFRNKQLVGRISVLQTEVDKLNQQQLNILNSGTKQKTIGSSSSLSIHSNNNVIREELESKINENALLHNTINELEMKNEKMLADYEKQLRQLLNDKNNLEQTFKSHETSSKKLIESLTNDNNSLIEKVKNFESKVKDEQDKKQHEQKSIVSIEVINFDINDFDKIYNENLNCLNKIYSFIDERFQFCDDNDHYLAKKFKNNFETLTKYSDENKSSISSVFQYLESFLNLINQNKQFINDYLTHEHVLSQFEIKLINSQNILVSELNNFNLNIKISLQVFASNLNEFQLLVKKLFFSNSSISKYDFDSLLDLIKKISVNFNQILNLFTDKLTFEHLNFKNSQNLITIDECINSFLIEFFKIFEKFKNILSQNSNILISKWNEFISTQNTIKIPNEGSTNTNSNHSSNIVSTEKLNLLKENEILLKMDLENVKTRWNTDKNLLANAENEIKELKTKIKLLEQQQQNKKKEEKVEAVKVEDKFEDVQVTNSTEDLERLQNEHELSIKTYYENEIVNLKYQIFLVDGKATYYYQEVEYLNENIKILMHKISLENQASFGLKQNINDLNDELETTRQRYEDQIRTMTEHIASMNDRLTEQAEMIEKFNNPSKNATKNKKAK